nr:MAG TPA: hypothetical protein [Bacteriophage sp.]
MGTSILYMLFKCSVYYLGSRPEDPGARGKPSNLYIKYTLSQFLAIFEVRRY